MIILLVISFLAIFLVKRRVGLLILALLAGSVLSKLWASQLAPTIADVSGLLLLVASALTSAGIIILPVLILVIKSPKHSSHVIFRTVGACIFAVLSVLYLMPSLERILIFDSLGRTIYDTIAAQAAIITTIGLVYAVFDVATTNRTAHSKATKKH